MCRRIFNLQDERTIETNERIGLPVANTCGVMHARAGIGTEARARDRQGRLPEPPHG
jgi:hypothetical protein